MMDFRALGAFRENLPEGERFETFHFFMLRWDVVRARYVIQQTHKQIGTLRVKGAACVYGLDKPQTDESGVRVDEARAMSDAIDTTIPVILALTESGSPLLIDGLHRLYRAFREGKDIIPCYALTSQEEKECRI
jgi:hypothetical protein